MLAVNAAKDATDLVAKLRAYHHTAQTKADKKHLSRYVSNVTNYYDKLAKTALEVCSNYRKNLWFG